MKTTFIIAALMICSGTLFSQVDNTRTIKKGQQNDALYNPAAATRIEGTITLIENIDRHGRGSGIHLKLQTAANITTVFVGPSAYLDKQDVKLMVNDHITVTGAPTQLNGEQVIIASRIEKGAETLLLRHEDGTPFWAGRGRNK